MQNCPACNKKKVTSEVVNTTFPYGLNHIEIPVTVTVFSCTDCGFEYTDHTAEKAKDKAVNDYLSKRSLLIKKRIRSK